VTPPHIAARGELARPLGLGSAVALVVGEVVGVGIFLTPAAMANTLGSPFWILVAWLTMGTMAALGALCYGELAARYPESGGGYVYLREAYGSTTAFLYGWKSFFVMDPGLTAALAMGLAGYARFVTGASASWEKRIAIAAIVTIALVNLGGVRLGAAVLRVATVLKLAALAVVIAWGFAAGLGDWAHFSPFVAQRDGSAIAPAALAGGMIAAFFSFGGWWDAAKLTGEVRDPTRNVPTALVLGVIIVTLVYVLTSAAFLYLVPIESGGSGEAFAGRAGAILFGAAGGRIFAVIVIVSVLSSLAALMMAAPRVYFAMARDGSFPRALAAVHPRFGTPARAIVLQAVLACVLVMLGSFDQVIGYFIFVTVAFVGLTVASIFVARRRRDDGASRVVPRIPGYPVTPLLFLALVAVLLAMLVIRSPREAALGVAAVALGWPVHRALQRANAPTRSQP
jgi:APA family basic amino acid/polyamine antiporter